MTRPLVVGLGNDLCGDDAAGLLAARSLAARRLAGVDVEESAGDAAALAGLLGGRDRVVVVDAVGGAGRAGEVLELAPSELTARAGPSSHGLGLVEALALARALGAAPRIRVLGICGRRFAVGDSPSPPVVRAARRLARRLEAELTCA